MSLPSQWSGFLLYTLTFKNPRKNVHSSSDKDRWAELEPKHEPACAMQLFKL